MNLCSGKCAQYLGDFRRFEMNKRNLAILAANEKIVAEEILREIQNQPRTIVCEFKTPVRKFGKFVKTETSLHRVWLSWTHHAEACIANDGNHFEQL
jgi:hypothetical protein